jgi:hypothetical protein
LRLVDLPDFDNEGANRREPHTERASGRGRDDAPGHARAMRRLASYQSFDLSEGSPLTPNANQHPQYAQLYFFDPEDALHHRVSNNDMPSIHTLRILQHTLNETNPYSGLLHRAFHDVQRNPSERVSIRIVADPSKDRRRYNPPTVNEIAAIISGDQCIPADPRDIILLRVAARRVRSAGGFLGSRERCWSKLR